MTRKELPKKMERMLRALETDLAGRVQFTAQLRGMIGEIAQIAREEGVEDLPAKEELDRDAKTVFGCCCGWMRSCSGRRACYQSK